MQLHKRCYSKYCSLFFIAIEPTSLAVRFRLKLWNRCRMMKNTNGQVTMTTCGMIIQFSKFDWKTKWNTQKKKEIFNEQNSQYKFNKCIHSM